MEYGYQNNKITEYDRQTLNKTVCSSESPTSSSVSSSSNLSLKNQLMSTPFKSSYDEGTMTSSTSQIFATAASLHVDQNETVRYTRETMHLLAKFLAENSNNQIFGPIYAFAPDNLAWLWAFFDWDEPLDLSKIPSQETYESLVAPNIIDEKNLQSINNIFTRAPLIQYKYREKIMIGDVCKFIEYIHSIEVPDLAKALFLLYFPRFNNYIENTLGIILVPKLLKSNIHLIKKVDDMIISLVKTRYTNVEDYKEKILRGNGLPSYISKLLKENNFWNENNSDIQDTYLNLNFQNYEAINSSHERAENKEIIDNMIFNDLFQDLNFNKRNHIDPVNKDMNIYEEHVDIFGNFDDINQTNLNPSEAAFSSKKTIDYMNQLDESNKINDDLDHISFDNNCYFNNINLNKESENINEISPFDERSNIIELSNSEVISSPYNCFNPESKFFSLAFKKKKELSSVCDYFDSSNSEYNSNNCTPLKADHFIHHSSSPQKLIIPPLQDCTPQTPSNLKNYILEKRNISVWSSDALINRNNRKSNLLSMSQYGSDSISTSTPPLSAKQKSTPMTISSTVCNNNTGFLLECIGSSKYVKNTNDLSFNHLAKYSDCLGINASIGLNDQYNSLYKNTFYGSPVPRLTNSNNKTISQNNHANNQPFSNLKQQNHRFFSSNSELPSSGGSLPKHSFLIAENHYTDKNNKINTSDFKINNNSNNINKSQQKHTWSGRLPPKTYYKNASYSRKVFLGGLPWDVNHNHLQQLLQRYGTVKLEIPGKDSRHPRVSANAKMPEKSPGYVYIIFDKEDSVQNLLSECRLNIQMNAQHFYFALSQSNNSFNNKRGNDCTNCKIKEVEVIPWNQEDTSFVPINKTLMALPSKIDAKSTIFVGALHGMLNAQGLGQVMTELYGEVIHASLDTDKYKYPIGSGRVTFRNRQSYLKAIKAKFVSIKVNHGINDPTPKFEKTIQIDPYLEEARCSKCSSRSIYFCRNEYCLDYFC